jgi:hypothetical protein
LISKRIRDRNIDFCKVTSFIDTLFRSNRELNPHLFNGGGPERSRGENGGEYGGGRKSGGTAEGRAYEYGGFESRNGGGRGAVTSARASEAINQVPVPYRTYPEQIP